MDFRLSLAKVSKVLEDMPKCLNEDETLTQPTERMLGMMQKRSGHIRILAKTLLHNVHALSMH